ncbi:MAG: glycosyltransferase family 39 protein [Chloroflexota bacterium]|nr:glycosyltransferase family 39 protein [Chloroflexota bacterium]MDQ5864335.1 glycosyltransferase family 39 protein [Chloroflexota bacterium]
MDHAQLSGQNNLVRSTAQADAPVEEVAPGRASLAPFPGAGPMQDASTEEQSSSRDLLASIWKARGLFGGMLAIAIAYYGQRALIERNDFPLSTFCYGVAIVVLILSLLHPILPWRRVPEDASPREYDEVVKPGADVSMVSENGHTSPPALAATPSAEATNDPPALPVRKAGSRAVPLVADNAPAANAHSNVGAQPARPKFEAWVPATPEATVVVRKARGANGSDQAPAAPVADDTAQEGHSSEPARGPLGRVAAWRAQHGWRVTAPAMLVAVGLLVSSFFALRANVVSPLGGWLWAGGIVALIVAVLGVPAWPRGKSPLQGPKGDFFGRGVPDLPSGWSAALIFIILLVAVALRLYNLEYHPGIFGDEGERGMDARRILEGNGILIFGSGWWGVPNLYFYLTAFFLGLLGDHNMVADRMLSVVSGVIAVWYVYRTGKVLWGPRAGLIAGALMAVSPLALQFSRLAGESTPTGTLWAVGFFYMVLALRDRKWTDWLLAGLAWGFSLYFYAAGKLIIPMAAALGFYCLVRWRLDFFKRYALGFALLAAAMLITAMPYLVYAAESNFQVIMGRAQETSIFSPSNQGATFGRYNLPYDPALAEGSTVQTVTSHPVEWARLIYEQARETLDVLYRRADQVIFYRHEEHGGTMFPPFWAAIVMLSLAYATWKLWDGRFALVLIWFWFGMLGSILTIDTPNLQRVTGAWPALMLFPAALLDRIFAAGWPFSLSLARRWATVPLAAAVLFFTYTSIQEYFGHYVQTCPYCDATAQARYALDLGTDYKAYQLGVGGYAVYFGYGSTRFLAKNTEGIDMLTPADKLPAIDSNGKGLAFLVYSNNLDYLPLLRLYYPGGTEEPIRSPDGVQRFVSYKVTREQLATFQVARATYSPASGDAIARDEPGLGTERAQPEAQAQTSQVMPAVEPWSPPAGVSFPVKATWEGGLVAPEYGIYSFVLNGDATDATLELDGRTILGGVGFKPGEAVELVLAKGVHEVRLSGTLPNANSKISLQWAGAGGAAQAVQPRFLYKGPTGGLAAELVQGQLSAPNGEFLKTPEPFKGQPITQRRVDPFVGFRETFDLFGSGPYFARWYGKLRIDQEGTYGFSVAVPSNLVLFVDGAVLIDGPSGLPSGSVPLSAGLHDIELRYASPGGGARIELLWSPPGGETAIIPPTALVPAARSWLRSEVPDAPGAQVQEPQPGPQVSANVRKPKAVYGTDAGLKEPRGLAVDRAGNVYVGDNGNRRVVMLAPDGKVVRTWGTPLPDSYAPEQGEAPDGQFAEIADLAVGEGEDGKTYIYVLDTSTRVQVFTPEGQQVGTYPAGQLGLYGPNGLAIGPAPEGEKGHRLYVSVTGQNRLVALPSIDQVLSREPRVVLGEVIKQIRGPESAPLEQPVDVLADPARADTVYAIDLRDRLMELKLQSAPAGVSASDDPHLLPSTIGRQWQLTVGRDAGGSRLAISPDGRRIYMSDPERNRVAVVEVESGLISYFGESGTGEGQFTGPSGIVVGADGTIYVLERLNNRVQLFDPDQ